MSIERSLSSRPLEEPVIAGPGETKQLRQPESSAGFTNAPHVRTESEIKKNNVTIYSPLSTPSEVGSVGTASSNVPSPLQMAGKSYAEWTTKQRPEEKMREEKPLGLKHDDQKPPLAYIPKAALWAEGEAFAFGSLKYSPFNYQKGIAVTRTLSAALRHIMQFLDGEDKDVESGVNHLGCARANLAIALHTLEYYKELDDRNKK